METNKTFTNETAVSPTLLTTEALLAHWQGHRSLTRKVIEAFPEDAFYNFSIGGMRTFSQLTMEMIVLAAPGIRGVAFGDWTFGDPVLDFTTPAPPTKQEVLNLWDLVTDYINTLWPQIRQDRFAETEAAFGMYENTILNTILYLIDNEIHHRGQGYVYLRALGVEPPAFWER
ncbi:DinB family protein [Dyadobacter sp. CY347]|uniref:DinB family protein n=1 Tax=Dyadobacter sp. CY347 TaxID=2909336 RepID=UPI001F2181F8|nr:DinB family protein [Dyadobacter sp. CY347]MCF2490653.1 DinB family protein [Dyadobacter sp. CY347]